MALAIKLPQDRKRVKVYELRDNDWFDRGTGFCTGAIVEVSLSDAIVDIRQADARATGCHTFHRCAASLAQPVLCCFGVLVIRVV